jgi:hypothetical protein
MVEAPRHLIRAGAGRVRVLRLVVDAGHCYPLRYTTRQYCRMCGCTEAHACLGGCAWADAGKTVCTACVERMIL